MQVFVSFQQLAIARLLAAPAEVLRGWAVAGRMLRQQEISINDAVNYNTNVEARREEKEGGLSCCSSRLMHVYRLFCWLPAQLACRNLNAAAAAVRSRTQLQTQELHAPGSTSKMEA